MYTTTLTFMVLICIGGLVANEIARAPRSVGLKLLSAEDSTIALKNAAPGIDFPILSEIPATSFNCKLSELADNIPGDNYHADPETGCQVFHLCDEGEIIGSFLCPNYTIFNDQTQVCEWFHQVACSSTSRPPAAVILPIEIKPKPQVVVMPVKLATITTSQGQSSGIINSQANLIGSGIQSQTTGSGWGSKTRIVATAVPVVTAQKITPPVVPVSTVQNVVIPSVVPVIAVQQFAKPVAVIETKTTETGGSSTFATSKIDQGIPALASINTAKVAGFPETSAGSLTVLASTVPVSTSSQINSGGIVAAADKVIAVPVSQIPQLTSTTIAKPVQQVSQTLGSGLLSTGSLGSGRKSAAVVAPIVQPVQQVSQTLGSGLLSTGYSGSGWKSAAIAPVATVAQVVPAVSSGSGWGSQTAASGVSQLSQPMTAQQQLQHFNSLHPAQKIQLYSQGVASPFNTNPLFEPLNTYSAPAVNMLKPFLAFLAG